MSGAEELWERLVRAALSRQRSGTNGPGRSEGGISVIVPSSLSNNKDIDDILIAADEIQEDDPSISRILCEHAYSLAQNLDPNSEGRGVLQFKTGLMSVIKQKLAKREGGGIDRSQDISRLQEFYRLYREKNDVDKLREDEMKLRESGVFTGDLGELERKTVKRKKVFATLKVLGTVLEQMTKEMSPEEAESLVSEEHKAELKRENEQRAQRFCHRRSVPARRTNNVIHLPNDLLGEIAKRLGKLEDFTCFRSASKSLYQAVERDYFEGLHLRECFPYLMLPPVRSGGGIRRQVYSLVEGEGYVASLEVPGPEKNMYLESLGWCLTVQNVGNLILLDPVSRREVHLPATVTLDPSFLIDHYGDEDIRFLVYKMVLTARPDEVGEYMVMLIAGEDYNVYYWRSWRRTGWRRARAVSGVSDIVCAGGGRFYAAGYGGSVWVLETSSGVVEGRSIISNKPALRAQLSTGCQQYVVKGLHGRLFVILRYKDKRFYMTRMFKVFEINVKRGTWKEVNSMGSMAVFVGRNSSIALDATEGREIKANSIYFTDDYSEFQKVYFSGVKDKWKVYAGSEEAIGGCADCGIFNLATGDVEGFYPVVQPLKSNICPAIWITRLRGSEEDGLGKDAVRANKDLPSEPEDSDWDSDNE